jgi:O-antigen/teichoic acid export membrane protein
MSLGLAMFADEIIAVFTTPEFYPGAIVVPILAPALILSGMYVLAPGLAIAKRTGSIALISIGGATLNTVLNLLLIPILGISGAALATLIGAASMFAAYMIISQRLYPVPHAWTPLALATTGTVGVFVVTQRFEGGPLELLAEVLGLLAGAAILIGCRLIEPRSIAAGLGALLRARTG